MDFLEFLFIFICGCIGLGTLIFGFVWVCETDFRKFFLKKNSVRVTSSISKIPPWRFNTHTIEFGVVLERHKDVVRVLRLSVKDGELLSGYRDVYVTEYETDGFFKIYSDRSSMKEMYSILNDKSKAIVQAHIDGIKK